ncbi:hypothetical protein BGZ65_009214 [Modicella reniformis]|uniref:Uncharacterized protein n=1 Tax=Modicella reniformis TaxID=1440133 RepID=A0A9P6LWA3_9FUNG|nr:hypothetical protein BGZ65_009214 [Modicella reniformis]
MQLETLPADSYPKSAMLSPVSIGCAPLVCPHGYGEGFGCNDCGEYPLVEDCTFDDELLLEEDEEGLDFAYEVGSDSAEAPEELDADVALMNALDDLEEVNEDTMKEEEVNPEDLVTDHQEGETTTEEDKAQPAPESDADVDPSLPVIEIFFKERLHELIYPSSEAFKTSNMAPVTRGALLFGNNDSLLEEPLLVLFDHLREELLVAQLGSHDAAAQYEMKMVFKGLQDLSLCEHEDAASSFTLARLVQLYVVISGMEGQEMLLEPFHIELTAHETFSAQLNRIENHQASKAQQEQPGSAADNKLSFTMEADDRLHHSDSDVLLADEQQLDVAEADQVNLVHSDKVYEQLDEDEFGLLDEEISLDLEITTLDSTLTSASSQMRSPKRTVEELIEMLDDDFVDEIDPNREFKRSKRND